MTDNNFRPYRSRDPLAPRSADAPARGQIDDPLAELARLIGQSEPMNDYGRDARHGSADSLDEPAGGLDWAADDRYVEHNEPAQETYAARSDERYEPPRLADPYPSRRPGPSSPDSEYEAQHTGQQPHYRDAQEPPNSPDRLPAFLPRSRAPRYAEHDQVQDGSDDQAYAQEDYEDEAPDGRRRGGFVVIAAVLGLAVLGTAGAFAYRAMFGGSMLPSLPPIIKAEDGPNRIAPAINNSKASTSDQADATTADSDEKLVSREEQPVAMPAAVNPAPRVVSTIPIFPDPNSAQAGLAAAGAPGNPATVAPAPVPPARTPAPPVVASVATPAPVAAAAAAPPAAPIASPEPKKVHTVPIRPDQLASTAAAVPAPPPPARSASVQPPASRPLKPAPAAPKAEANAPLSIVPGQGDMQASAPARTRTALAQPTPLSPAARGEPAPAPAPGGSYAVQVTAQRSEAEAQTAFRALRAKFPTQLGGHEPIIRRADLGDKGVFYRALVGPFASMEQAAGMC